MGEKRNNPAGCFRRIIPAVVLLAVIALAVLPQPAAAVELFFGCPPGDQQCEIQTKELQAARGLTQGAPCQPNLAVFGINTGLPGDITCFILVALDWIVSYAFLIPFWISEYFFTWSLNENLNFFAEGSPIQFAVKIGFPIVLGVANMFFVLILLWIAIATIFDFEPFTARQLLVPLIIGALLINFSLPIARAIINLSHGIGNIFYNQLTRDGQSIRSALNKAFPVDELARIATSPAANETSGSCAGPDREACVRRIFEQTTKVTPFGQISAAQCDGWLTSGFPSIYRGNQPDSERWCKETIEQAKQTAGLIPNDPRSIYRILTMGIVWKAILYPIAIFVLAATAIILLVRIVSLAFVLIFGPAAFLMGILPQTRFLNAMWWSSLFKWSLFFPAFMFLFWLSMVMVQQIPIAYYQARLSGVEAVNIYSALGPYLLAAAFLIASLMISTKFGIEGAGMVTGWGKKLGTATGKWARGKGWKLAGRGTGAAISRVPGARYLMRVPGIRQAMVATMAKGEAVARKEIAFYHKLPDSQLAAATRGMRPALERAILGALPNKRKRKSPIRERIQELGMEIPRRTREELEEDIEELGGRLGAVEERPPPS